MGFVRAEKRKSKYEIDHEKRKKDVLKVFANCGIDENNIKNLKLFNNPNTPFLIDNIYWKIFGFKDDMITLEQDSVISSSDYILYYRSKFPDGKMNIDNLKIALQDDAFIVYDENNKYMYTIDEHCLIYVNEEPIHYSCWIPTFEDIIRSKRQFYKDLKSRLERSESALLASQRAAENIIVKK